MAEQQKARKGAKKLGTKAHNAAYRAHPITPAYLATWQALAAMSQNAQITCNLMFGTR